MPKSNNRMSKKAGLPPGTLVHIGDQKVEKVKITLTIYDSDRYEEKDISSIEESFQYRDKAGVLWINIDGLHDINIFEKLGAFFAIHPLVLEDVLNTGQRPKIDFTENYIFMVLRMLQYYEKEKILDSEQVSIVSGSNFVISFQEKHGDVFDPIRDRIRNNKGKIRKEGADYLFYSIIDTIVDNYFAILEKMEDRTDALEDELLANASKETLHKIHRLKMEMLQLRKSIWPLREIINGLMRGDSPLVKNNTRIYFRDVYDHTIQVIDNIENFRDMASGMLDIYLSSMSNKLNEIMKVLTIIATIFIPLTFIAGLYGMNFKTDLSPWNMPELSSYYGYPAILSVMATIGIVMLLYFRKKNWF
jgi:magnesium transporter